MFSYFLSHEERESAWSVGCLSLGEGVSFRYYYYWERIVPRKYERRSAGFLFVQTPAPEVCVRFSTSLVIARSREWGSLSATRRAALCAPILLILLSFCFYPRGGLFAICWLLGICWQFREGLNTVMSWKDTAGNETGRKENEKWHRMTQKLEDKRNKIRKIKGNSSAGAVIRVESS